MTLNPSDVLRRAIDGFRVWLASVILGKRLWQEFLRNLKKSGLAKYIALAEEAEKDKNCSCYDGSGIICKRHFYGEAEE